MVTWRIYSFKKLYIILVCVHRREYIIYLLSGCKQKRSLRALGRERFLFSYQMGRPSKTRFTDINNLIERSSLFLRFESRFSVKIAKIINWARSSSHRTLINVFNFKATSTILYILKEMFGDFW